MKRMIFFFMMGFVVVVLRSNFFITVPKSECVLLSNDNISKELFSSLHAELESLFTRDMSDYNRIESVLRDFPIINEISIARMPLKNMVKITVHKPLCLVNQEWVLTDNNQLHAASLFSSERINDLVCIATTSNRLEHTQELLSGLVQKIPCCCSNDYLLTVVDRHHITLADKNDPQFTIVYSSDQILSPSLFDQCKMVKNNIIKHEALDKNSAWIADVRFADYIVVYKA